MLKQFVIDHIVAVPVIAAGAAAADARNDSLILFALRFFDAETIKDELDRLDALAKAQVDKDASAVKATVNRNALGDKVIGGSELEVEERARLAQRQQRGPQQQSQYDRVAQLGLRLVPLPTLPLVLLSLE